MKDETQTCGTQAFIRGALLLQEKWILLIVQRLSKGPVGFNELCREAGGVCATTLSQRLDMLEESGLVKKTIHSTMPPRTSYELTDSGRALKPVLKAIEEWAAKWLPETVARTCGERVGD